MCEIQVRKMRRSDSTAVVHMMRELTSFHGDKTPIKIKDLESFCFGKKKLSNAWVACHGRNLVGFVVVYDRINFIIAKVIRNLDLLFVKPNFRKRKIGRMLLRVVIEDMLEREHSRLLIGSNKGNRIANNFYQGLGLKQEISNSNRYIVDGPNLSRLVKSLKMEERYN
jgi:ribosomal protein S18 acetylase RimI-like enzyme